MGYSLTFYVYHHQALNSFAFLPAAYFLQNVVMSYEQHLSSLLSNEDPEPEPESVEDKPTPDDKGKEASNLIVLLSELYNFQVISSVLVFDIIRTLLNREVQEYQVELLLKIVKSECYPTVHAFMPVIISRTDT